MDMSQAFEKNDRRVQKVDSVDSKQREILKWNDRNGRASSKLDLNSKHEGDKGVKSRSRTPNQAQLFQQEFLRIQSSIPNIQSNQLILNGEKERRTYPSNQKEQFQFQTNIDGQTQMKAVLTDEEIDDMGSITALKQSYRELKSMFLNLKQMNTSLREEQGILRRECMELLKDF